MALKIFPVKPIYSNRGSLIGIDDPNEGKSRLPTQQEKIIYAKPIQRDSRGSTGRSTQPAPTELKTPSGGTKQNIGLENAEKFKQDIILNAYIKSGGVREYIKDPTTLKEIPVYNNPIYVESAFNPDGSIKIGERRQRTATIEEIKQYNDSLKVISQKEDTASLQQRSMLDKVKSDLRANYQTLNRNLRESVTYPIDEGLKTIAKKLDINPSEIIDKSGIINELAYPLLVNQNTVDVFEGIQKGIYEDIRDNPLGNLALLGIGAGAGAGFKAGATVLSKIPKVGKGLSTAFKVAGVGYGGYETAKTIGATTLTAIELANQNEYEKVGEEIGNELKDLALFGVGFNVGETLATKGIQRIKTRGREELDVEKGVYPQADVNKQLELFQKNIYKEIADDPVAFHTTSEKFFDKEINPLEGTSEIAGLYASTQVSTPFSRIKGSGGSSPSNFDEIMKSFLDSLKSETDPAIASLEPIGFRESRVKYSDTPVFEGQKRIKGKGYAYFERRAEAGFLDIPKIKTEIEAVARIEAGGYEKVPTKSGKKFYVDIEGVRVPVENFKSVEKINRENIGNLYKDFEKLSQDINKEFNPEAYSTRSIKSSRITSAITSGIKSSVQSQASDISSSISSEISDISSSISSDVSGASSRSSSTSRSSSSGRSQGSSSISQGSSSNISRSIDASIMKDFENINRPEQKPRKDIIKGKSASNGFDIYIKKIKTSRFIKINEFPLNRRRAKDVAQYYLDNSLARTTKLRKSGVAVEDYQFVFVPEGYYEARGYTSREFRVRKGQRVFSDDEIIKRSIYLQDTQTEKELLKIARQNAKDIYG